MFIKYEFVKGTRVAIDVDDMYAIEAEAFDSHEKNLLRRDERRGNESYDGMLSEGEQFSDGYDLQEHAESNIGVQSILRAIERLEPQQRVLLQKLLKGDKTVVQIAQEEGVDESAIRRRLARIRVKIKKSLK